MEPSQRQGRLLIQKYQPTSAKNIIAQQTAVEQIIRYIHTFKAMRKAGKHKPLLLFGPPGVGKTASVVAIAAELDMELLEINASDTRDKSGMQSIVGSSSNQRSLFGKDKIILVDELDGITGDDRGGMPELVRIAVESSHPIVCVATDIEDEKLKDLRKVCQAVEYKPVHYNDIAALFKLICDKENIPYDESSLRMLATRSGGDVRAALIDLQTVSSMGQGVTKELISHLSQRQQEESIQQGLVKIFKTTDVHIAESAFEQVNEDYDVLRLWIDESLPKEYKGKDLMRGYQSLSRANIYSSRIMRRQHWRFLSYVGTFLSVGIALAKDEKSPGVARYDRGMRLLRIWQSNRKHALRKSIAEKLAAKTHCSKRRAFGDVLVFKHARQSKTYIKALAATLELSEEETAWLLE